MENTIATMMEYWCRGDEAMRDFTGTWFNKRREEMDTCFPVNLQIADSTKDTKVDQHVNYSHLLRLFEGTKADLQH
uniref:Uncharacterized protein n=1 Tax=Brassica campestris TaxID=3711 RepID=A0A3P6AKK5_BRACM|nr:unnamed protein product [Brassica rapa]